MRVFLVKVDKQTEGQMERQNAPISALIKPIVLCGTLNTLMMSDDVGHESVLVKVMSVDKQTEGQMGR